MPLQSRERKPRRQAARGLFPRAVMDLPVTGLGYMAAAAASTQAGLARAIGQQCPGRALVAGPPDHLTDLARPSCDGSRCLWATGRPRVDGWPVKA